MAVQQTRDHFLKKYGYITDNPAVGKELSEIYWKPGCSADFRGLVEKLTGRPLSAKSWVDSLKVNLEEHVKEQKVVYDKAIAEGPKFKVGYCLKDRSAMK